MADRAKETGEYLISRLREMAGHRPLIGDVRGRGLMIGIELVADEQKTPLKDNQVYNIILDIATLGMLVYYRRNVIGLMPPLIIDNHLVDEMVAILDQALATGVKAKIKSKARLAKEFAASKLK